MAKAAAQKTVRSWRKAETYNQVIALCDKGVLMRWADVPRLAKILSREEQLAFISYSVQRMQERIEDRYFCEITIENQLIWLSHFLDIPFARAFIDPILANKIDERAIRSFVEISMTTEMNAHGHAENILATAVSLICEIGKNLVSRVEKDQSPQLQTLLGHITTYLLSVSNQNNYAIRLSLFHYFGYSNRNGLNQEAYDKIMNRFGFTVLDYLLSLLFTKKSEATALKFLLENIPFVLTAESSSQKMVHHTLKYYMLKKPERFLLFLAILTDELMDPNSAVSDEAQHTYLQHLGALFKVAAEINHKDISLELFYDISRIHHPYRDELVERIFADEEIKEEIKENLHRHRTKMAQELSVVEKDHGSPVHHDDPLHAHRRGRKPHIATSREHLDTIEQITELSAPTLAKVS